MSQNEKTFLKVAVLTLGVLAFQACGKGFQASNSQLLSSTTSCDDIITPSCPGGSLPPAPPGLTTTPNLGGLAVSLGQILGLAVSNFPGISSLATCQSMSACAGAGPSSQTITTNCALTSENVTGTTGLTFNGAQCSPFGSSQITIVPTIAMTMSGQSFAVSSSQHVDYSGATSGGGLSASYSLLSASASISDLGLRITGTGTQTLDISSHSLSPSSASVNISSAQITLNGGQLVLADNRSQYSATLTPNNLGFGAGCACPTSGSVLGPLSGSLSGTLTMTFNATCGSVTITALGTSSTSIIPGCNAL